MTSADQFKVIDPLTIEVTLPRPDKLALPNLATVYPLIINSKLAKAHATPDDPWAVNWLKENEAGSGAYIVETFKPGEQVVVKRNEAWNRGSPDKPAFFKRFRSRRRAPIWSSAEMRISSSICRQATCNRSRRRASSR